VRQFYPILIVNSLTLIALNSLSAYVEARVPFSTTQAAKFDRSQAVPHRATQSTTAKEQQKHPALVRDPSKTKTREQAINWLTDLLLNQVNSELDGRKLQPNEFRYINEWTMIRQVVAQEMNSTPTDCVGDLYWELPDYDWNYESTQPNRSRYVSDTFNRIADAIFYSRHPEWVGKKLPSKNSAQAQEWKSIRQAIIIEKTCS
jgi:hypothetical protein